VTATMMPPATDTALAEVDRQIDQLDAAMASGVHGWAEEAQEARRVLLQRKADLLGALGSETDANLPSRIVGPDRPGRPEDILISCEQRHPR
jgi:hypothetical protein